MTVTIGHRTRERRGSILLLVLFLMAVTAPMICLLLDAHATHTRCVHNDIQARTALYLAEAGVQRAVGELVADPDWRAGFAGLEYPAGSGHRFTVTLVDDDDEVKITSTVLTADGYTRTVVATVAGF